MTDDQTLLDLAGRATPAFIGGDRPSSFPGGCDCQLCGSVFVGDVMHTTCDGCERQEEFRRAANPERIIQLVEEKRSEAARADLTGFMLAWVVAAIRPAQPPRKPYVFHSLSACAGCGCSGDDFGSVNVEAFEVTGELYCDDCADEAIESAAQEDGE